MAMTPTMSGKNLPMEVGMMETSVSDMAVIMPVPFMMPVKQPAANSTEHIIRQDLAWASTLALDVLTSG